MWKSKLKRERDFFVIFFLYTVLKSNIFSFFFLCSNTIKRPENWPNEKWLMIQIAQRKLILKIKKTKNHNHISFSASIFNINEKELDKTWITICTRIIRYFISINVNCLNFGSATSINNFTFRSNFIGINWFFKKFI